MSRSKQSNIRIFVNFSRTKAEQLLNNERSGTFLMFSSERDPDNFTLSIKCEAGVQHYTIQFNATQKSYTIDGKMCFSSLRLLVQYYEQNADFLCCRLETDFNTKDNAVNLTTAATIDRGVSATRVQPIKSFEIDYRDLSIGKIIGSGEFSNVYEGTYREYRVAIKMLKESNVESIHSSEAAIMSSLRHRHVVQFLGVTQGSANVICLVMEFMAKGSLFHYLTTRGRSVISQVDLLHFAIDICEGLNYLEQNRVVHRDIAASNVLIADDNTAKISDFGLAKRIEAMEQDNENSIVPEKIKCRTRWTALEALESKRYTYRSDVWSYGIFLWELFSYGRCPYPRIPAESVLMNLKQGYRMEPPGGCPAEIGNIMRQTWLVDVDRRPSASQMLERLKRLDLLL